MSALLSIAATGDGAIMSQDDPIVRELMSGADARIQLAKEKLRTANAAYDNEAAIEAHAALLDAHLAKDRLEANLRARAAQHSQQQPQLSPAARSWIAKHPEFDTDPRFRNRAIAAHHDALAEGHQPDSPEYFAHIDRRVGSDTSPSRREPLARSGEPRSSSRTGGKREDDPFGDLPERTGHSREDLQKGAQICNMTPEEYAAEMNSAIDEGEFGKVAGSGGVTFSG
jgi:hypothetical protein